MRPSFTPCSIRRLLALLPFATCVAVVAPRAPLAQASFDATPTAQCLLDGNGEACIGRAAELCVTLPGNGTTIGLGYCYGEELAWWDSRLNAVYVDLRAKERATDAEMAGSTLNLPSQAEALKAMQRAWISYRDAACEYEYSQWSGGTGGGPASAACQMELTARQTLWLERYLLDH
ncbi:MAG: lysozyme inhibitor LprI family protein [Pseudomonadota bacterium]